MSVCSGTVIHPQIVLTAGHCINEFTGNNLSIGWGTNALKGQQVAVTKFKYFPDVTTKSDIALLITATPLPLTAVRIGNPSELEDMNLNLLLAGYGHRTEEGENSVDHRDRGQLLFLRRTKIAKDNLPLLTVEQSSSSRITMGDSGGPLFRKNDQILILHGIVSQSVYSTINTEDGEFNEFSTHYTHPFYYLNWMNCSLPESHKIRSNFILTHQVACDSVPLMDLSQLSSYNSQLCEKRRPGFKLDLEMGCWPSTLESCTFYAQEVGSELEWDEISKTCKIL
jgi:hypothetical protein